MNKLICFTAEWCNPCKAMKPTIDSLDQNQVVRYDIDTSPEMRAQYEVRAVPTFIVEDSDGQEVARHIGSMSKTDLVKLLEGYTEA